MLLDDDLYTSSSTAVPFSPSQHHHQGVPFFAASPNPAESDGYRITWGPSAGSILADIRQLRNNAVSSVKRTSANAGLASPTRQGAAGFGGASLMNNNIQPLRNWVPQQPQLASNNKQDNAPTSSKTATASRFSKRRRRYPSGSILATDCDRAASSSGNMEIDDSTLNASTLSMFDELQKRLEAKRAAAQAEREAELAMEKENSMKRQQDRKQREDIRGKGKGKAKVCSPILELLEKSHGTQSQQQQAKEISSNKARQVLQPKQDQNTSRPSSQQSNVLLTAQGKLLSQTHSQQPHCSTPKKGLKADTYRMPSQPVPSSPVAVPAIGDGACKTLVLVKRHGLERKTSSSTSVVPDSQEAPVLLVSNASKSPVIEKGKDKDKGENDDVGDYWNDEEDKSLEMEMSQMTFPAAPASQTASFGATKATTTNPPAKSATYTIKSAEQAQGPTWTGFKSRDKRAGQIACASIVTGGKEKVEEEPKKSSGGLSTKPLARVAAQPKPAKTAAMPQKTVSAQLPPTKSTTASATTNNASSKHTANEQAKSPAVKKTVSAPVMQPAIAKDPTISQSRMFGNTTAPRGLTKTPSEHACSTRWKPPTIVNKQKSLAAKEKFVKTVGVVQVNQAAPYVGDDLDGVDFDDDSF